MIDLASIRNASFTLTPTGYHPEEVSQLEMIPFDRSIAAAAARERRTIIVNDVRKDSRYLRVAPEGPEEPLSEIAVPLILTREQRVVGVR